MRNVNDLLAMMAAEEAAFEKTRFVAPCLAGGRVRTRVGGIVQTFRALPEDFCGWGLFQAEEGTARLIEEADLPLIDGYLAAFPKMRLRLARQLSDATWLGYPVNEADMMQRFGVARPVILHLVTEGARFEAVIAHCIGATWWFADVDRRADPMQIEALREAFRQLIEPVALAFSGLTPEMRTVYDLAAQADPRFEQRRQELLARARREAERTARTQRNRAERDLRADFQQEGWQGYRVREGGARNHEDERRLRQALRTGGGDLRDFNDRGEYYLVEWTTANGHVHTSAITKADLTVISSGICLSGRDRDFDLQSLVGVIEQREW